MLREPRDYVKQRQQRFAAESESTTAAVKDIRGDEEAGDGEDRVVQADIAVQDEGPGQRR